MRWRALLPARSGWLRLLAAPSTYLLVLATLLTTVAKLHIAAGIDDVTAWPLRGLLAAATDVACYLGLAAVLAFAEHRVRPVIYLTIPLSGFVLAFAAVNAIYLWISGEQLTWPTVSVGLERLDDVRGIAGEISLGIPIAIAVVLAAGGFAGVLVVLRRRHETISPRAAGATRAHAAVLCAVVGLVLALVPRADHFALARLDRNAAVQTYRGLVTGATGWSGRHDFAGFTPAQLATPDEVAKLRAGARPNIVLIILESTGREVTSLAGARGRAQTPNLAALAARGTEATNARSVLPHTTKSVFSILCGRLPFMQSALFELSSTLDVQCLPALLDAAGWRTGFFQSSAGKFEDRPRLVHRLGYRDLAAHEDLGGPALGYLASDDNGLAEPLARWIDAGDGAPFLATVLTAATHHPYEMSEAARARAAGKPAASDRDRHARLVEEADLLVGRVLEDLAHRGLAESTIVVVVGDHGEGFGDKGIRQHDNNFFEEGLHVPWVMTGPGVPHRQITADTSLADVTPTLLALLGVTPATGLAGANILEPLPAHRVLPFACWYDGRCRGFVRDREKVVFIPELDRAFGFDLEADPHERSPRGLTTGMHAELERAGATIDAHRTARPVVRGAVTYPTWVCDPGSTCKHR